MLFENGVLADNLGALPEERPDLNLRTTVMQRIRLEIVSGKAGPKTVLSVPTLAKALGVSTTPVREALLELVRSGLLEPIKNRGFRVLPVSVDDLNDLAEVRVHLESLAVAGIKGLRQEDHENLVRLANEIQEAYENGDIRGYVSADRTFHLELISLAGNRYLTEMIMFLRDNMRIYGLESEEGLDQQRRSVLQHFALIDLIQKGDMLGASKLISAHILGWVPVVSGSESVTHVDK